MFGGREEKLQTNQEPVDSSVGVFLCFLTVHISLLMDITHSKTSFWYQYHIYLTQCNVCTITQLIVVTLCYFKTNLQSHSLGFCSSFHTYSPPCWFSFPSLQFLILQTRKLKIWKDFFKVIKIIYSIIKWFFSLFVMEYEFKIHLVVVEC